MVAANNAVIAPVHATTCCASGTDEYNEAERVIRYTAAVTMVAAWISAETGVGPAIASGSQTYNGICALLPAAPINRSTAIEVAPPATIAPAVNGSTGSVLKNDNAVCVSPPAAGLAKKLTEPVTKNVSMMPRTKPQSPMRLVMNAFFAASPASLRSK